MILSAEASVSQFVLHTFQWLPVQSKQAMLRLKIESYISFLIKTKKEVKSEKGSKKIRCKNSEYITLPKTNNVEIKQQG